MEMISAAPTPIITNVTLGKHMKMEKGPRHNMGVEN